MSHPMTDEHHARIRFTTDRNYRSTAPYRLTIDPPPIYLEDLDWDAAGCEFCRLGMPAHHGTAILMEQDTGVVVLAYHHPGDRDHAVWYGTEQGLDILRGSDLIDRLDLAEAERGIYADVPEDHIP